MSKLRRTATSDERALFEATVEGRKLEDDPPIPSLINPKPAAAPAARPRRPSGIDGRTAERLRKGLLEPDATLDLHGFTEAAAHHAVAQFLRTAVSSNARLVLIITGKGERNANLDGAFECESERQARGVLRATVPRWLQEAEFIHSVADIRTAHRRHGGAGALYVYLRKDRKRP